MAVDVNFKRQAEVTAFYAFMKVMKKYKLYFPLLKEICAFIKDENPENEPQIECLKGKIQIPVKALKNGIDWGSLFGKLSQHVENNAAHNGMMGSRHGGDSNYDYLIHCVNTMIQVFVEFRLMKRRVAEKIRIPKFEVLGQEIFDISAKKLFGRDFVDDQPQSSNPGMPRNDAEAKLAAKWFHEELSMGRSHQEAGDVVARKLAQYRASNGQGNRPQEVSSPFYINNDDIYYDSDDDDDDEYYDDDEWDNDDWDDPDW